MKKKEQFLFEYKQLCKKYRYTICFIGSSKGKLEVNSINNDSWFELLDKYIKNID